MADIFGTGGNDTLTGTPDADFIRGLNGNDVFFGGDGDDVMEGGEGLDSFTGGQGNDYINGRYGNNDVANFAGSRADYAISYIMINGLTHARVTGLGAFAYEGVDTMINVEYLQFADIRVSIGINPNNRPVLGDRKSVV